MTYPVSIDLKQLPIQQRNKIVNLVKRSRAYYKLEKQIISSDLKTMKEVLEQIKII